MSTRELSSKDWQKLLEEPWKKGSSLGGQIVFNEGEQIFVLATVFEDPPEANARLSIVVWAKRALSILLDEQKAAQLPEGLERTEVLRRACIARIQLLDDIEAELP